MKIAFKIAVFYFMISMLGISVLPFASASDLGVSRDSHILVCIDKTHLMEIYQLCIDDSVADTSIKLNIAIESLNNMISECHQDEPYVRAIRASCFVKENKLSKALFDYQFVLSDGVSSSFIHSEIGLIYLKQGRYKDAIQEFSIGINKGPNSYLDYVYRARAYKELGNPVSALSNYRSSLKFLNEITYSKVTCESCYSPTEVDIYLEMGNLLEQSGNAQEVIALYMEGLKNNPGSLELKNKLTE